MKTRLIVVTGVGIAVGLLGWLLLPSSTGIAQSADGQDSAERIRSKTSLSQTALAAVPVLPSPPAQVAAPVVPAAKSGASTLAAPAADTFVAQPQADLKTCIATVEHFLEMQDMLSLVKTIAPPDVKQRMIQSGQAASMEDMAERYRQMPDVADKMAQLRWALQDIQNQQQEPEMSADGSRATYKIDTAITRLGRPAAPVGTPGTLSFVKVDGFWYLR